MTLPDQPDSQLLSEIEALAIELAQVGGNEIRAALGSMLQIRYKGLEEDPERFTDPVSEVDGRVEQMIRERLAERFPDHDIIGEEMDHRPGRGHDFVWAVDPIDGTTNFINGFPLFASSVGVLFRGRPVVGALWCSTSHALEAGVYHAIATSDLRFNGAPLATHANPAIRRRLGGEPHASRQMLSWDGRKTGSAAIECAFVAAGLLDMAWFERPNIWDVAGGMALVSASGRGLMERRNDSWHGFDGFGGSQADLAEWTMPVALGKTETLEEFVGAAHL
jgi:myo-inositol-1(or 4)-monophosphatase